LKVLTSSDKGSDLSGSKRTGSKRTIGRWRGAVLLVVALSVALAGCGGASDAGSADSSTPGSDSSSSSSATANSAASPRVTGTPPDVVAVNQRYDFQPTVTEVSGDSLSFSIQNKPGWASFNLTTGALAGTPTASDAGEYKGIVISASDGTSSSALAAFAIQVVAAGAATGGTAAAATAASPSGTMIPSATQIVDAALNVWTVRGGAVQVGGAAAGYTANVVLLLYFNGSIYQQNKSCLWWNWNGSTWVASGNPAPSLTPACASAVATASGSSSGGSTSTTTPTGNFGIQVKGDKFVSASDGSTLQIVGTNISGLETGSPSRWASFANAGVAFWSRVINFDGQGVNTVRLPLNEASWLNYTCYDSGTGASGQLYSAAPGGGYTPDPAGVYQATVKKAVADATAAGLYVILDLHWGSPNNSQGQPLCPIGQPAYADADHSLAFWKSLADTFKGNPAVIFELFNEPFGSNNYGNWVNGADGAGPDAITLRDGGAFSPFLQQNNEGGNAIHSVSMSWQVAGMQDMVNTIRAEGATNVILSSPIGWAGEIETWLAAKPTDPIGQLGVAWHVYGYNKGTGAPLAVLAAGYPIAITETYGLGAIGGYGWAASQRIGYIWWGWNDWGNQPLTADLNAAPWSDSTAP
jgi:hypothetical protein